MDVLRKGLEAEHLLELAVGKHGTAVTGRQLTEVWAETNGKPPRAVRWERLFEPGIAAGRVAAIVTQHHLFYRPTNQPELLVPSHTSDLSRVEEATRRATVRWGSAVLVEEIEGEIRLDDELTLLTEHSVSVHVATLVKTKRVLVVQGEAHAKGLRRQYYSMPDGPRVVRAEMVHHLQRRRHAITLFWIASGGQPFTTTAIRKFAASEQLLAGTDGLPYEWTNALHYLEELGEVIRVPSDHERFVRWAPAREWCALSDVERALRMQSTNVGAGINDGTGPLLLPSSEDAACPPATDAGFVSRNHSMRLLIRRAKLIALEGESDPTRRQILQVRPVTVMQLAEVSHALGLGISRHDLREAISEATRLRNGMRRSAVSRVGVVGRRSYFDELLTDDGHWYVSFLRATQTTRVSSLKRSLLRLQEAIAMHESRVVPIVPALLYRRVQELESRLERGSARLSQAMERAPLLPEERLIGEEKLGEFGVLQRELREIMNAYHLAPGVPEDFLVPDEAKIDTAVAWDSMQDLASFPISQPRMLPNRIPLIPVTRAGRETKNRYGTRRIDRSLDRLRWIWYVAIRWGDAEFHSFAQRAIHAIGDLRELRSLVDALHSDSVSGHAGAAAALGLWDTREARDALASYISNALVTAGEIAPGASVAAIESAVYGLAPLPVGGMVDSLSSRERDSLLTAIGHGETNLGWIARRVVRAWDESWSRDALLRL